jgi:hypothetical protein
LQEALLLLLKPTGVVAFKRETAAAIELQNPFGQVFEEVTLVGNGHHGARVFLKKTFQPQNAFGVEVVSGLIEQ